MRKFNICSNHILGILLSITIILSGCSLKYPQYVPHNNQYQFHESELKHTTPINTKLVYTYDTKSLEQKYRKIFCSKLSDCSSNINRIKNSADFGNFNLDNHPIANNPYGINTIDLYRITYTTSGQLGNTETVSGGIWVPNITNKTKKIKGIVLYFHPTFFYKLSVPSYAPTQKIYLAIAANLVSQGYIVVAPDYIGMGSNWKTVHPYVLYPQVNVIDGLSILTATQQFLDSHNINNIDNVTNTFTKNKLPLFVTGYSEGAAYALWFSRLYQEQEKFRNILDNTTNFKLTSVVPISGAYDLSNTTYNFLLSDINFTTKNVYAASNTILTGLLKPVLTANAMLSYAYYSQNRNYLNVFNPDFFNMKCRWQFASSCQFDGKNLNLAEAFNYGVTDDMLNIKINNVNNVPVNDIYNSVDTADKQHTLMNVIIADKVANAANYTVANNKTYTNQTNSILPLINPKTLNSVEFNELLLNGNVHYWHSTIPTTFIYLQHDSIVSNLQSQFAYMGLNDNKSKNVSYVVIDNNLIHEDIFTLLPTFEVDHITAPNYLMLVALNQFNKINSN